MASIQSHILEYWIRRLNIFGDGKVNPQSLRLRIERIARKSRPHRKVQVVPIEVDAIPSEWLIPIGAQQDRALLYIHGGAWFMGSTNTHRAFVSKLAFECGISALVINYRLAPENPFPAGLHDCIAAYDWLMCTRIPPDKIVVAGDSAGGNLALALLIALRDAGKPLPAGAVALSPVTDLASTGESHKTRLQLDPFFSNMGTNSIIPDYITDHDPRDPLISPLYGDLSGLPPLLIHAGDHEVLLDDAVRFGDRAKAAGVDVNTVVWPGMFHVFQTFSPILPEARQAINQIARFIRLRVDGKFEG
jgi:monoterpene epsilon-lactone hydrolase